MKKGDEKMENDVTMRDDDEEMNAEMMDTMIGLINEVIIENVIADEMIDDGVEPDEAEEFACNAARELLRE
jgi:hypothetical protein